jgi:hypothetical protein
MGSTSLGGHGSDAYRDGVWATQRKGGAMILVSFAGGNWHRDLTDQDLAAASLNGFIDAKVQIWRHHSYS